MITVAEQHTPTRPSVEQEAKLVTRAVSSTTMPACAAQNNQQESNSDQAAYKEPGHTAADTLNEVFKEPLSEEVGEEATQSVHFTASPHQANAQPQLRLETT